MRDLLELPIGLDFAKCSCEPRDAVWLRVLFVLSAAFLFTRNAGAQAPPASVFDGRTSQELRAVASDRHNDVLLRRAAATRLVMTLADEGDFDGADAAAREFEGNIDPFAVRHARAVRRRHVVHVAGLAALAIAVGLAVRTLVAARRSVPGALRAVRRIGPVIACFLLYAGVAGGCLASSYENSSSLPFVFFAALMLPLVAVFRMWSAVGSPSLAARIGRGLAAVAATLAVGFLVVEHVNATYLDGFGL